MITAIVLNRSGNIVREIKLDELPGNEEVVNLDGDEQAQVVEIDGNLVKLKIV